MWRLGQQNSISLTAWRVLNEFLSLAHAYFGLKMKSTLAIFWGSLICCSEKFLHVSRDSLSSLLCPDTCQQLPQSKELKGGPSEGLAAWKARYYWDSWMLESRLWCSQGCSQYTSLNLSVSQSPFPEIPVSKVSCFVFFHPHDIILELRCFQLHCCLVMATVIILREFSRM